MSEYLGFTVVLLIALVGGGLIGVSIAGLYLARDIERALRGSAHLADELQLAKDELDAEDSPEFDRDAAEVLAKERARLALERHRGAQNGPKPSTVDDRLSPGLEPHPGTKLTW